MRQRRSSILIGAFLIVLVLFTVNAAYFAIQAESEDSKQWEECALKYQSEAMNLGHELEDLKTKYEELCVSRLEIEIATQQGEQIELPKEPKPLTLVDIIPDIKAGVVHLQCPSWQGSAFVVGPRFLVTARHCVEGVTDFRITTDDGHILHATRAISSEKHDVAFIYIDDLTCIAEERGTLEHKVVLHALKLGNIAECQLGQRIITIGSGYGKVNLNSVTLGIVSGLGRDYDEFNSGPYGEHDYGWSVAFQTDSPGHPGNSGCPVFTVDGVVRGILVGGFSPSLIICMPVDLFLNDIEEINRMFTQGKYYHEKKIQDYYEVERAMKLVKTHTFNGIKFDIDVDNRTIEGYCDSPHGGRPGIHTTKSGTCQGLETLIHESLHAENWAKGEMVVTRTAKEIARFLWRLGYRRIT